MNIQIICIGKLKEKYWTEAIQEYAKRLSRFCALEIIELKEARLPDKASAAEEALVKQEEGREILKAIKPGTYVITLEILGKTLDSPQLADKLAQLALEGKSNLAFVIGGSLGLGAGSYNQKSCVVVLVCLDAVGKHLQTVVQCGADGAYGGQVPVV